MNLSDLRKSIPYSWKIQSFSKDGKTASCVAYLNARDVMNLLDETVGPGNWQDAYATVDGKLVAGIGIYVGGNWIWKHDVGTESDYEKEKGQFSDAFKRAAVKWGVGRFLYDLEIEWVNVNPYKRPIDEKGVQIKDLTKWIEDKHKKYGGSQST